VFENDSSDFIVPLDLYVTRLKQLEDAVADADRDVEVEAFFGEEDVEDEDAEFVAYPARGVDFSRDADNGQALSHPSLSGSGYNSVRLDWILDSGSIDMSPWELSIKDADAPYRPKLDENEKRAVRKALSIIRGLPNVDEYFRYAVADAYTDYHTRVEVPMFLNYIIQRLEGDYYSTRYSVVADVRLLHTNSAKYNGDNDDLTQLAAEVVATFEENILNEEERAFFHKYDAPISGSQDVSVDHDTVQANANRPSPVG